MTTACCAKGEVNSRKYKAVLVWSEMGGYHKARSSALNALADCNPTSIVCSRTTEFSEFAVEPSANVISLDLPRNYTSAQLRARLDAALTALKPDVVFALGWSLAAGIAAIHWCEVNNVRCVVMSESNQLDVDRWAPKEWVKRQVVSLTHAALVGASDAKNYLINLGMPANRIFLGYDAVDNQHFAKGAAIARSHEYETRKSLDLPRTYFLLCARLVEKKNHLRLIDAYSNATRRLGAAVPELLIVGPGPLENSIRDHIIDLKLSDKVKLKGAYTYEQLPHLYGLACGLILPSFTEQWGLVVNEAMAASLPVLVSNRCGSARDLVEDGVNGFLFDPFNVKDIEEKIVRFSLLSEEQRIEMGDRSREIISNWDVARFAMAFDEAARAAISVPYFSSSLVSRLVLRMLAHR